MQYDSPVENPIPSFQTGRKTKNLPWCLNLTLFTRRMNKKKKKWVYLCERESKFVFRMMDLNNFIYIQIN